MKKAAKKSNSATLSYKQERAEERALSRKIQRDLAATAENIRQISAEIKALNETDRKQAREISALIEIQSKQEAGDHEQAKVMIAIAEDHRELAAEMKALAAESRKREAADRKRDESDRKRDEADRKRGIELGGISRTQGLIAEDLFTREFSRLMREAGIKLTEVKRRVRRRNHGAECDIVGLNGSVAVVGEVKTRLYYQDVQKLLSGLLAFREDFPKMARPKIYGAVAGMTIDKAAEEFARKQGLFVLAQSGAGFSSHTPPHKFTPKAF